jgi:hypothetical protein
MHFSDCILIMYRRLTVQRLLCAVCTLLVSHASVVLAQGDGCPKGAGTLPLDDPTAQQIALLLGGKWYNPEDHPACDSLPTSEFLDSINMTKACVDPPYAMDSAPQGTSQTFFVSFDGTVPCSQKGKETLLKENPDIPFTLQFEAEATYPSPGSGDGKLQGELVGPANKPEDWSISGPIKDSGTCPEGTTKGTADNSNAMAIAKGAASAYYKPEEHETCGSQPTENFLSSINITNVCVSPDGSQSVNFDVTMPCTDEGKKELLAEKPYAFTFLFEATGDAEGNPISASIVGGDGKLAPQFTCPGDTCTFSTVPGSPEQEPSSAGGQMVFLSVLACIVLLMM